MLNGPNARLVILLLFITVIILVVSIVGLTITNHPVPQILIDMLSTVIGVIGGAIGLHPTIQSAGEPLLPLMTTPKDKTLP